MPKVRDLKIDQTKLITQNEYAKMVGLTKGRVSQMMSNDELRYVEVKGTKLIYLD
jgi:hypothetical protein